VLCSLALAVVAQPLLFLLLSTGNLHRIYSAGIVGAALLVRGHAHTHVHRRT
jgi:hypothetical protein